MGLNFPTPRNNWQFDLVGLLAVIGESIVDEVVQPLTASPTIFLPRLLPAPHALIRPSRRTALPSTPITGIGVYTGNKIESIPYFASMVHQVDLLRPFEFQEMKIELDLENEEARTGSGNTKLATVQTFAPLKLITIFSSLWTAGILAWAITLSDGPAVVAIICVSLASSSHSAASYWQSKVQLRPLHGHLPPGDLVFRTREGAFIVVHCSEEVARLLYRGDVSCDYVMGATAYRILIYVGTVLLMVGIVVMSNCSWTMQVVLGVSYLALNVMYMFCALTPDAGRSWHWSLRLVKVVESSTTQTQNYTECLARAIQATREIRWVKRSDSAPATKYWDSWLEEAKANSDNRHWNAQAARDRLMVLEAEDRKHGMTGEVE